ncbi:hypothetical protein QFC21_006248 [Naganishia friedmannii]|uniref:Uncharacterized protein n=1 Tax=Naganishia friedmannii TaxID=89922 RepID=A0ACC2V471_9TREE|nr:hypothetical protein QFC21_006248 [Naganishia friedmannii]
MASLFKRPSRFLVALVTSVAVITTLLTQYPVRYPRSKPVAVSLADERDGSGYSAAERMLMHGGDCEGWSPPSIIGNGTRKDTGCWKDKWHAQLGSVLENWEEYSKLSMPASEQSDCYTVGTLVGRHGENKRGQIWSITQALDREHYTFLTIYHRDYAGLVKLYSALPDVVTTVWAEDRLVVSCMADPRCRSDFPQGEKDRLRLGDVQGHIPAWKVVTPSYFAVTPAGWKFGQVEGDGFTYNTLSHEWVLSPFPYPGHFHIPLSVEETCMNVSIVPRAERKDEAVILGKLFKYFWAPFLDDIAPPPSEIWADFYKRTGLTPIANAEPLPKDHDLDAFDKTPRGIVDRGPIPIDEYTSEVGHAKMMIGIGSPVISPSPYLALCQGVPVLIPYNGSTPTPSGFNLYKGYTPENMDTFWAAVQKAKDNPIEPYLPDEMRLANVERLTFQFINRNAHALALKIQQHRRRRGLPADAKVLDYQVEKMFSNGWGTRLRADGTVSTSLRNED